jgi:hypothetical protein
MMIEVGAVVHERRQGERTPHDDVPRGVESRKSPFRQMGEFVNEEDGAVEREDRHRRRDAVFDREGCGVHGDDERRPTDRRRSEGVRPVDEGVGIEKVGTDLASLLQGDRLWACSGRIPRPKR